MKISDRLNPTRWVPDADCESIYSMTILDDIASEFDDRVLLRGGLRLFRARDAIALIRRYRDAGVRVLGIDAFMDYRDLVQPSLEHSIDFSTDRHRRLLENSWEHAEQFVRTREATSFVYEVVPEEPTAVLPESNDS